LAQETGLSSDVPVAEIIPDLPFLPNVWAFFLTLSPGAVLIDSLSEQRRWEEASRIAGNIGAGFVLPRSAH
jgi:hypothetical protein